jgi:hypothetical protein
MDQYVDIEIPNEFFCDDCKLKDKITEKAILDFLRVEVTP